MHSLKEMPPFLKMLVLLSISCCLRSATPAATYNSSTDLASLLAFKSGVHDPTGILSNNWTATTSTAFCSWFGVTCSRRRPRVTSLRLKGLSLHGTIAPHLANLSFLSVLSLRKNALTGPIPASLGHLPRLRILKLTLNQLTGAIPPTIFNISSLLWISLAYNNLSGPLPMDNNSFLPPRVRYLDLEFNQLDGDIPPSFFSRSFGLQVLSLSKNRFTGTIPTELGSLLELNSLSLDRNYLTGLIPAAINNLTKLTSLNLGLNNLTGKIPPELGNLPNLQYLLLPKNDLTGSIPHTIFNMSSLIHIILPSNNLLGPLPMDNHTFLPTHVQSLNLAGNQLYGNIPPSFFSQSYGLQVLGLDHNQFTGPNPAELGNLQELNILYLDTNYLTGSIPAAIGNLTKLTALDLSWNNLTGKIPLEVSNLPNLQWFGLQKNNLHGGIPPIISNLTKLTRLDLSYNNLTMKIPQELSYLPNLQYLVLDENELTGSIPASLFNISTLIHLDLAFNKLSGPIRVPSTGFPPLLTTLRLKSNELEGSLEFIRLLTNCRFLQELTLAVNEFDGILPASIGNLSTSLVIFEAWDCNLKGKIPAELGNLSSLTSLFLGQNELEGTLPPALGGLEKLQVLSLDDNMIYGQIPGQIGRLKNLYGLQLVRNSLSGPIPDSVGNLTELSILDLASNELSSIPQSIWSLQGLVGLYLSNNSLHGILPPEISNLKEINLLDLSMNRLSGSIPNTTGGLEMIEFLDLSHNSFWGAIPQELGGLINIVYLNLSYNLLTGIIPNSLAGLHYIKILNLSYNRLEGKIPDGGVFSNITIQSLVGNVALCGSSRLGLLPCPANDGESTTPSRTWKHLRVYLLVGFALAAIFIICICLLLSYRHRQHPHQAASAANVAMVLNEHRVISYQELIRATNGFSEANLLGRGSFGSVFRGCLDDGLEIAVKVLNLDMERASKSFDAECRVLSTVRHRNLLRIISTCSNNLDFKALVLQFMPNGSLERWLYSNNYCLSLLQRINVMQDVALALEYLHHHHHQVVVHCDLKPSNVLLDEDMTAHLSDFGISKLLFSDSKLVASESTVGTIGYIAPEYASTGKVSRRGDIYSYGILLLETFTRRKPTDPMFSGESSLRQWVDNAKSHGTSHIVDGNLLREAHNGGERPNEDMNAKHQCLSSILNLGLLCSRDLPKERILMNEVVLRLEKIKKEYLAKLGT